MPSRLLLARLLFGFLALGLLTYAARLLLGVGYGPLSGLVDDALYTALELGATLLVGARAAGVARDRGAWTLLTAYLVTWTIGDLGWTLHFDAVTDPPFPNWTDAFYVASYGFAYAGLILILRGRVRPFRASLWLDGLVGGLALGGLCTTLFFGPIAATSGRGIAAATTLAYPVLDVVLLCLVMVGFGLGGWRLDRVWVALGLSLIVMAVGDAAYSYQEAVGSYSASSWTNITWPAAMLGLAAAAVQRSRSHVAVGDGDGVFVVPALFATLALGLLLWSQTHRLPLLAAGLAAGALVAAGGRALLTHRENVGLLRHSRHEALTDNLTSLGNRRHLMADLDDAVQRAAEGRAATLAFFDLDGFKAYNDAFGHGAGDALLQRLARALTAAVASAGSAYRLGGDEFCVLLDRAADGEHQIVDRAAAALSEQGEGFSIDASYGVVALPNDATTAALALQLADERMYADKGSRRASPRRQARDLLLQIIKEREPALEQHVGDVGMLAGATARQLGQAGEVLDETVRGAELHDIGKIAVPEAILHKAGPLDAGEWQIMRQHTVMGERILAAAPALRAVGSLVRSSHERFDGGGYPDGLAGERIPLGARIIAVCDAFDAMRQERPYAAAMGEDEALDELRRCAGTQFDPVVVDAFAVVVAQGAGTALRVS
ncbi:MAG TPA: HD domain-containing phosphohydrolase [Baekduia sp.]|jgi:diguanylate cyclase (GGDEF)-like protein|nr:HD domain-containing phosphohydrolase [Baekduia sp.]